MKYNEIERLQQLAGIITEIKVNTPLYARISQLEDFKGFKYDENWYINKDGRDFYYIYAVSNLQDSEVESEYYSKNIEDIIKWLKNPYLLEVINEIKINKPYIKFFELWGREEDIDAIYYNLTFNNTRITVVDWLEKDEDDNNLQIHFYNENELLKEFEYFLTKNKIEYSIDREIDIATSYVYVNEKYFKIK